MKKTISITVSAIVLFALFGAILAYSQGDRKTYIPVASRSKPNATPTLNSSHWYPPTPTPTFQPK